ncbi:MAG: prolyl oligopeptidase family serine peptidase [Planctomycetaceae bacterium]|nr:prolyl oligopeptidase family serine peptidase [Planctomycetaceae bacterium]
MSTILVSFASGQGSRDDYERANTLEERTRNKVFRDQVDPHWQAEDRSLWYRVDTTPGEAEFVFVDMAQRKRVPLFDHEQLATQLAAITKADVAPAKLPFTTVRLADDEPLLFFSTGKGEAQRHWEWNRESHKLRELDKPGGSGDAQQIVLRPSPSGGAATRIELTNGTNRTLQVYWLNFEGEKQRYGSIRPGDTFEHNTYVGHLWLIANDDEQPLELHAATSETLSVTISNSGTPGRRPNRRGRRDNANTSPDGKWRCEIHSNRVWIVNSETEEEIPLSDPAPDDDTFGGRVHWSPDSQKLVVMQTKQVEARTVHIVESSPKDQLQPILHSFEYAKPGDDLPIPRPTLFDVTTQKRIPIDDSLFKNPWSIDDIHWWPDSSAFAFHYNQRGHQVLRVLEVNANSGDVRTLIEETSPTFVDYAGKHFLQYLDDTREILWMSERDGWNHLYLVDAVTGQVKHQLTSGEWVVRKVERVDEATREIWFSAGGMITGEDPYFLHLCRVNFDGSVLTQLTSGNGTHLWQIPPTGQYLLDVYSRIDLPPVTNLRDANSGELICELEQANMQLLEETGWQTPEPFVAKGRDGTTDIYGMILRPTNFDPAKKYPVIEYIYAGPHSAFVPKSFSRHVGRMRFAELGFIVVQIDGMGTSHRSKAFHDVCWQNLGDSGFPDRIAWMQAAAEKHPEMDISRVGIFGGSAGGQSTLRALLAHPDFYDVGCADCGCHDNRMDKVWWNELWMGWPVGPHYADQSNVTNAHKLEGKLLLMVGELDRNVDPASTMQVVDALIKAEKDFDLIVFPGAGHGAGSSPYGIRRQMDFFVRHLHGREPRWTE